MRVTRLLITGFRGWERLDLRPDGHVLLAGVPRAGRTDIIMALARVLDPHAARNPLLSDLHQECPAPGADENGASNTPAVGTRRVEYAEVEVTLTDCSTTAIGAIWNRLIRLGRSVRISMPTRLPPSVSA